MVRRRAGHGIGHGNRRRGIVVVDALTALLIVAGLLTLLLVTTTSQRRTGEAMAEQRELVRLAERVAFELARGGQASEATTQGATIMLRPVPGEAVNDHAWTEIRVERNGRTASLIVLAPRAALHATEGAP